MYATIEQARSTRAILYDVTMKTSEVIADKNFIMNGITHPCWGYSLSMLIKERLCISDNDVGNQLAQVHVMPFCTLQFPYKKKRPSNHFRQTSGYQIH